MAFKLRSGNKSPFKAMGGSAATDEQKRKNLLKAVPNEEAFNKLSKVDQAGFTKKAKEVGLPMKPKKSPAKQRLKKGGEAQDENKIFDRKGKHVGNYVNDKKVMFTKKQLALMPEGNQGDFTPAYPGADIDEKEYKRQLKKEMLNKGRPAKRKSPAKQLGLRIKNEKKTFPKSYTKKDIKFLKKQREDIVRREDLDAAGKKIYDANQAKLKAAKKKAKSPAKQADKRKGLGPSKAFGGVKNPELINFDKKPIESKIDKRRRKVMKDGSSSRAIYKGKVVKNWTNPYAVKADRSPKTKK